MIFDIIKDIVVGAVELPVKIIKQIVKDIDEAV